MGQRIFEDKNIIENKFRENVINKRRELNIEEDEDYCVINMDETAIFLEMSFNTIIDFKGNKHINIDINGRENYRITALLSGAMVQN